MLPEPTIPYFFCGAFRKNISQYGSPYFHLKTVVLVFLVSIISACTVDKGAAGSGNATFALPNALQVTALPSSCSGTLEATITIDGGTPNKMSIRAEDGKAIYKITEWPLGMHEFLIEFKCQSTQMILLASANISQEIIDGPNVISFANTDYLPLPDLDGDNISNLSELINGSDPFTVPEVPDTTPPSAPTMLQASNVTIASSEISWTPASDTESGVANYKIYRDDVFISEDDVPPFLDEGLTAATTYSYQITAIDGAGNEGPKSTELLVTTPAAIDTTPPTAPGAPQAGTITTQSIELLWTQATDAESGVSSYKVYRDTVFVATVDAPPYVDTGLLETTTYSYQVTAINGDSFEGPLSVASQLTTATAVDTTPPSTPGTPQANNITPQSIEISWSQSIDEQSGVVNYQVYRDNIAVATVDTLFYLDSGLSASTAYTYEVSATNGVALESQRSAAVILTTLVQPDTTPPTAPGTPSAINSTPQSIELTWSLADDAESGIVNYQIYRDNVAVATVTAPPYLDTGLTASTSYTYEVSANNGVSIEGPRSVAAILTTLAAPDLTPPTVPGAPTSVTIASLSIEIDWTLADDPESGVVNYQVYRDGIVVATIPTPPYLDTGLAGATNYSYQVSAINGVALESPLSTPTILTTLPEVDTTAPTAPGQPVASNSTTQSIELSWTLADDLESGIVNYLVYRDTALVGTVNTPPYVDTGLSEATSYTYYVTAVNGVAIEGPQSIESTLTTLTDIKPPNLQSVTTQDLATEVTCAFSEPISTLSATTLANYQISPAITISNAILSSDMTTVTLTTSPLSVETQYTLTVNNIMDLATTANVIATNSNQTFSYLITGTTRNYQWDILTNNSLVYTDENFTYETIPTEISGSNYLRTLNFDKTSLEKPFLSFTVLHPVILYVGYDVASPPPTWLATGWQNSGLTIDFETATDTIVQQLYTRSFPSGQVVLDNQGDALFMYTVFLKPDITVPLTTLTVNSAIAGASKTTAPSSLIIIGVPE